MAVRIIHDDQGAVLYCSTDMEAFGPVFDALEEAEDFLDWLPTDPRRLTLPQLRDEHSRWHELTHDSDGEWTGRDTEPAEPTDDEIYNRVGVEGGIGYSLTDDSPGSLGENDWRL
jgi:hypothetical protein